MLREERQKIIKEEKKKKITFKIELVSTQFLNIEKFFDFDQYLCT